MASYALAPFVGLVTTHGESVDRSGRRLVRVRRVGSNGSRGPLDFDAYVSAERLLRVEKPKRLTARQKHARERIEL